MAQLELWDDLVLDTVPSGIDRLVKQAGSTENFDSVQLNNIGEAKFKVTTAGDIVYATGQHTLARLGIGSVGQVLTVASGTLIPAWESAGGGYVTGDVVETVLYDEALSVDGNFDISSISQDYDHLVINLLCRSSEVATLDNVYLYLNNDTTATNYFNQYISIRNGNTISGGEGDTPLVGLCFGTTGPANSIGYLNLAIPFYTESYNKGVTANTRLRSDAGQAYLLDFYTEWESTSAINRITIQPDGYPTNNFIAGSRMQLVGIKTQT